MAGARAEAQQQGRVVGVAGLLPNGAAPEPVNMFRGAAGIRQVEWLAGPLVSEEQLAAPAVVAAVARLRARGIS